MKKFNFYLGSAAGSWLLVLLVLAAEFSKAFKNLLEIAFKHHWIGKAVIITIVFIAFGFVKEDETHKRLAWYSVLASLGIIFLFYAIEFVA